MNKFQILTEVTCNTNYLFHRVSITYNYVWFILCALHYFLNYVETPHIYKKDQWTALGSFIEGIYLFIHNWTTQNKTKQ